jgi:restriction system protein
MEGILVTTSYFGSDAYEFCKDKLLTLINGDELLYLLQKQGYKARINLAEARFTNEES